MIKIGRLDQFSLAQEQLARSKLPLGLDKETKNKKKGKEKRGSKKKAQKETITETIAAD